MLTVVLCLLNNQIQYDHVELSKISYWVWLLKDTLNTMFNKGFYVVCICLITLVNIGCITVRSVT